MPRGQKKIYKKKLSVKTKVVIMPKQIKQNNHKNQVLKSIWSSKVQNCFKLSLQIIAQR